MAPAKISGLNIVLQNFLSIALTLVGLVAIIMIVVSGIHFLSAGGDKEGAAKAKNTLTFAIIGLIVAISAWMILNLFGSFLGINVGTFNICLPGETC